MPPPEIPDMDMSDLKQGAIAMFELYNSLLEAGFSRRDAIKIVVAMTKEPE